jgi:3-oxoacyl-[acyl-carrier protein] reductase
MPTVLITGASKGLGQFMVDHFLKFDGYKIIGCARSASSIVHPNYQHHLVDVSSEEQTSQLFLKIRQSHGKLDVLINNAGVARMNALALTPIESIRSTIDINYIGTFMCIQKAIRLLRKSAHPRVINMTTVAVPMDLAGEAAYAASKSAVESLTRIAAKELSTFNITCNAIGPSPIETDLIRGVSEEKIATLVASQAIKKMAKPEDVTNILDFFMQPKSDLVTGQIIYLGGIS